MANIFYKQYKTLYFVLLNFSVDISMVISYNMLQYIGERNTLIIMDDADSNDADQVLIRIHFYYYLCKLQA